MSIFMLWLSPKNVNSVILMEFIFEPSCLFKTFLNINFLPSVSDQCITPLGLESGEIEDSALSASSSYEESTVGPKNARYSQARLMECLSLSLI